MAECSPTFQCRGEWDCYHDGLPYYSTAQLAGCVADSSEYGCDGSNACSLACASDKSSCYSACGEAIAVCSAACARNYATCFQACMGNAACEAACLTIAQGCGTDCADADSTCRIDCDSADSSCLSDCATELSGCQTACGDTQTTCLSGCTDDYVACSTVCIDAFDACFAACAGDPVCEAACGVTYDGCESGCTVNYEACNADCASDYAACIVDCGALTCEDTADAATAEQCFLNQAACALNGCSRELTDCLLAPSQQLIADYFDANSACITCKSGAFTDWIACLASCDSGYTTCFDACAGDAGCEAACAETLVSCYCDCDYAKATGIVACDAAHYVSVRAYRLAAIDCEVAEGRRTAEDSGIDAKSKWCGASSLSCRRDCYGDRESAYDDARANYFTCYATCYTCGVLDADCTVECERAEAVERAAADNAFDDCSRLCCQQFTKPFDDDSEYEDAFAACANAERSCLAECTGLTGMDYSDCTDACADALADCEDELPEKPHMCVDCSFMEGTAYDNPYASAELDFTSVSARCNCTT